MMGPKRREIGHGLLAERALFPVVPNPSRVPLHNPYCLRHHELQRLYFDGFGLFIVTFA